MVQVILEPYDVYTTPIKHLACLEDVIDVGYDNNIEANYTVSISIRTYPAAINFALDSLIHQKCSTSFSFIKRHAVLYSISLLQEIIDDIASHRRNISDFGELCDLDLLLNSSSGLKFKTMTVNERTNIHLPFWCKEYISSNRRHLGMSSGSMVTFLLVYALSRSTITNPNIASTIQTEADWFLKYLNSLKDKTLEF